MTPPIPYRAEDRIVILPVADYVARFRDAERFAACCRACRALRRAAMAFSRARRRFLRMDASATADTTSSSTNATAARSAMRRMTSEKNCSGSMLIMRLVDASNSQSLFQNSIW